MNQFYQILTLSSAGYSEDRMARSYLILKKIPAIKPLDPDLLPTKSVVQILLTHRL